MDSFEVALRAVFPFICYIALGLTAKVVGRVKPEVFGETNRLVFRYFVPFLVLNSLAISPQDASIPYGVIWLDLGALIALILILMAIVPRIVAEDSRRGVIIQASYRSNAVLLGLPIANAVFGSRAMPTMAILISMIVPVYNISAVLVLETFNGGRRRGIAGLLVGIIKNPMIQAAIVGFGLRFLGIALPPLVMGPIKAISDMTTPLMLFILGGTLRFSSVGGNLRYLLPTIALRLLFFPAAIFVLLRAFGYGGMELFCGVIAFATPVATVSYSMAREMGGDADLAAQLVVISTVASLFTLFCWVFFFGSIGQIN